MSNSKEPKSYEKQLNRKVEKIQEHIKKLRNDLSNAKTDKEWFEIQTEINSQSVNLETQKSRIENLGKREYIPENIICNTKIN